MSTPDPSSISWTRDVVELVRALAWPVTVLCIVMLLRKELRSLTQSIAERAQTDTIEIGPRGVTITSPLPQQLQERKIRFRRYVAGVDELTVLVAIARRINVPAQDKLADARKVLIAEMNRRVTTDHDMDRLSASLRRITRQDF